MVIWSEMLADSVEYFQITQMDAMFGYLVSRLKKANLYDKMNILIVSDHGMAQLYANQTILLGDYIKNVDELIHVNKTVLDDFGIIYPKSPSYVSLKIVVIKYRSTGFICTISLCVDR